MWPIDQESLHVYYTDYIICKCWVFVCRLWASFMRKVMLSAVSICSCPEHLYCVIALKQQSTYTHIIFWYGTLYSSRWLLMFLQHILPPPLDSMRGGSSVRASDLWEILIKVKLNLCIKVFIRTCHKKLLFSYLGYYCSKCLTGLQPCSCCGWATRGCCPEIGSRMFWVLVITESCDLLQILNFLKDIHLKSYPFSRKYSWKDRCWNTTQKEIKTR